MEVSSLSSSLQTPDTICQGILSEVPSEWPVPESLFVLRDLVWQVVKPLWPWETVAQPTVAQSLHRLCVDRVSLVEKEWYNHSIGDVAGFLADVSQAGAHIGKDGSDDLKAVYQDVKPKVAYVEDRKLPFRFVKQVREGVSLCGSMGALHYQWEPPELRHKLDLADAFLARRRPPPSRGFGQLLLPWIDDATGLPNRHLLRGLRARMMEEGQAVEKELRVLERVRWLHGSNSGVLPGLLATDGELLPLGLLLGRGVAPMSSGELAQGIRLRGINRDGLSGMILYDIPTPLKYSKEFRYDKDHVLQSLRDELAAVDDDEFCEDLGFDRVTMPLRRLRQWDEELYQQSGLATKAQEAASKAETCGKGRIPSIRDAMTFPVDGDEFAAMYDEWGAERGGDGRLVSTDDSTRIGALMASWDGVGSRPHEKIGIPSMILHARRQQPKAWAEVADKVEAWVNETDTLVTNNLKRLNAAIDESPRYRLQDLLQADQDLIVNPAPMIFASTTIQSKRGGMADYLHEGAAKLGTDIDVVFTTDADVTRVKDFFQRHGWGDKVNVYPYSTFENVKIPLSEGPEDGVLLE